MAIETKRSAKATPKGDAETAEIRKTLKAKKALKPVVLTLRVDEATHEWLGEVAAKKGVGTSTLARMWLLERLGQEPPPASGEWV